MSLKVYPTVIGLSASEISDLVREAVSLVSRACRNPGARDICEELEDVLLALLDEAGDPESVTILAGRIAGLAADELERAADKLKARGLTVEAELLAKASSILRRVQSMVSFRATQ